MGFSLRTPISDLILVPETTPVLPRGCGVCGKEGDLRRCTACSAIPYCGREHQEADRKAHRPICDAIKKERANLKYIEAPNAGLMDLMESRLILAGHLERVHSPRPPAPYRTGTQNAALLIRLDEDKEAYAFLKSWVHYEETNTVQVRPPPYLKNVDVLEPIDLFLDICDVSIDKTDGLGFLACLACLKVKLLLDLRAVEAKMSSLGERFSHVVLALTLQRLPRSPVVATNPNLTSMSGLAAEIAKLESQVHALYRKVDETNRFFWSLLAYEIRDNLKFRPVQPQPATLEEAEGLFLSQEYL
ncbi:hypothetical protein N7512_000653 [Penicillium capsulatum]|nr:hypothetical protein N7512_000653 [Penicillium capsulatum]